ncbi:MAG: hypothetical protein NUW22_01160 [Acidobacteria bacterium]|nr:hypothetical protein [Acidobacteriota bacterium]
MRGADFRRRVEARRSPVASAFEVWSKAADIVPKASSHVLKEAPVRSGIANDPETLGPEVALVGLASLLAGDAGDAVRLARKSGNDASHLAAQESSVE